MTSPYSIAGPALISFSGGRTSAFMLHEILRAHGGRLPDDVVVAFANTGKEHPKTLRFVHECQTRWGVPIRWVEWRMGPGRRGYAEVGFNSASRNGEPFEALIRQKQRLPNGFERWCTEFLKVVPLFLLMKAVTGLAPGGFVETIGLRDDEGLRILKGLARAEKEQRRVAYPLAKAKVVKAEVMRFWLGDNADPIALTHPLPQGFDLGLRPHEGNCTLCFQKGRGLRKAIIRDMPGEADWWDRMERETGGFFDKRNYVRDLVAEVRAAPGFFDAEDEEYDVECGLHCATEEAA